MHVAVCAYEPEQRGSSEKRTAKTRLADFKGRPHIPKAELKYAAGMSFRCSRLLALVGGYRKESSGTKRELISQDLLAAGPVSRILSAGKLPLAGTTYRRTAIPLGRALLRGSSDLPGGLPRRADTSSGEPEVPPYLVLLRVGFALPATLLRQRCALTAPFHPYLAPARKQA